MNKDISFCWSHCEHDVDGRIFHRHPCKFKKPSSSNSLLEQRLKDAEAALGFYAGFERPSMGKRARDYFKKYGEKK